MKGAVRAVLFHSSGERAYSGPVVRETLDRVASLYPGVPLYSNRSDLPASRLTENLVHGVRRLFSEIGADASDSIAIFQGIAPLLDPALSREAFAQHTGYFAHYTWGEDIPPGFIPDFASREFFDSLNEADSARLIAPYMLREHVYKNINDYDAEIFYRRPDLRKYRLDFTCESDRSERVSEDFLLKKSNLKFYELESLLLESPELYRPFPSYVEIEMTTSSDVRPDFFPVPPRSDLSLPTAVLDALCADIDASPFRNDVTVTLGGSGDPLLHPELFTTVQRVSSSDRVRRIYIETFATRMDAELLGRLAALQNAGKIEWIVRLTTLRPDRYRKLYGADLCDRVLSGVKLLDEAIQNGAPFRAYAEILKIRDVQDEIEGYFNRFEKTSIGVILQKFNRYIDLLAERRVSDLTPLHRDFCWHLARDIYITASGRVPVCRQDPFANRAISFDILQEGIEGVYAKSLEYHVHSVRSEHEAIPMPCLKCDEWYTFMG
jgi:spiro-SPASM protein